MSEPIHIISLGAGVQSSTMALMAAKGEIAPKPTASIFADTQSEPENVYKWLGFLSREIKTPLLQVSDGNLREQSLEVRVSKKTGNPYLRVMIPAFTLNRDGSKGMFIRTCTDKAKVTPVNREFKRIAPKGGIKWLGITTDESHRMKDSGKKNMPNRYPLAMELGMNRQQCLKWMSEKGYPQPPRSACEFCPYHSDAEWIRLQREDPQSFDRSIKYEKDLQSAALKAGLTGIPFLHDSRKPLSKATFSASRQGGLFGNECEGMCGV